MEKYKLIAYYLPQFYEIEFNNKYWGQGYTEWTTTAKAKPLFKNHYQPHIPADLGFYNLLMPEAREAQAKMAQEYGIDGFCYWHYWFGEGETCMEKPIEAVLKSGKPDFPFCLAWANHSWHNPATGETIRQQRYPGKDDYINHFYYVLKAFKDSRYIKIEGKPIFSIFEAEGIPDLDTFIDLWNELAQKEGFPGIYFIGISQMEDVYEKLSNSRLDAINTVRLKDFLWKLNPYRELLKYKFGSLHTYKYTAALKGFIHPNDLKENTIPSIITGWDHSPRTGKNGMILTGYTPEAFEKHLHDVFNTLKKKDNKLCFVKSWNEWGEGNHLEPDLKWGKAFLEVLKRVKNENKE